MSIVVLHLSDIHLKSDQDPILARAESIAKCAFQWLPSASHIFILVSGDIAFSGASDEYALAASFLQRIKSVLNEEKDVSISFLLVPGNHDCNFELNLRMRQIAIDYLAAAPTPTVDDSVVDQCTSVQVPFFAFKDALEDKENIEGDKLWTTYRYELDAKTVVFECLNVSWFSRKREEQGTIYFPHDKYADKTQDGADVRILVMHHPLNWFGQVTYRPFRTFIRRVSNIVITGHEHQGNVGENVDADSAHSAYIEGCVLQGEKELSESSFNVVIIDLDEGKYKSTRYEWKGGLYQSTDDGSWADFRDLPRKQKNPFEIRVDFRDVLDDPGAFFRHPNGRNLGLGDIYVFPDMSEMEADVDVEKRLSSALLRDPDRTANGVLLQADEKVGRTSLLYRLFDEYHDRGYVPVLINGRDIKKSGDREVEGIIRRCVSEQYGRDAISQFEQLSRSRKILLLDDFDESPIKSDEVRARLLS